MPHRQGNHRATQTYEFTVIGVYEDSEPRYQRYAETFTADRAEDAESQAPENLIVAGVVRGAVPMEDVTYA
jgi:hypothetical protein